MTPPDTARRSLDHWSEPGQVARDGRVRLLDVACGSGKFPAALLAAGLPADPPVDVDLLDPSSFSVAEARGVLAPPFRAAAEHVLRIQDLTVEGAFDVAWATHALYALPPAELGAGVERMVAALRPGGFGAVAQASSRSHYLAFYEAYRATYAPDVTPYTDAEGVAAARSSRASCSAARSTTRCRWRRWRPTGRWPTTSPAAATRTAATRSPTRPT